jgi:hypothetical protein
MGLLKVSFHEHKIFTLGFKFFASRKVRKSGQTVRSKIHFKLLIEASVILEFS